MWICISLVHKWFTELQKKAESITELAEFHSILRGSRPVYQYMPRPDGLSQIFLEDPLKLWSQQKMKFFFTCGVIFAMASFFYSSFWHLLPDYEKIADKITEETAKKMKRQKNLYLVGTGGRMSVFSCLFGCSSCDGFQDYEKIADNITKKTAKKLKEQKKLCLVGTGGKMMDDIQAMDMSFYFYQEVDLKEARKLIVYVINEYLSEINASREIKRYLHEYPFTAKNVEIRILIYEPDGTYPPLDKIFYISAIDGILTYYLDLPETYSRRPICKETYEDALKIVDSRG